MPASVSKPSRKAPRGIATNDLVFSARMGHNSDIFPGILALYVAQGNVIADVTYGKGTFWKLVPDGKYRLLASDLNPSQQSVVAADARSLPYADDSIDCVVFDPPYMHSPGGTAHVGHQSFEEYYKNNGANTTGKKYHEAVLDLYLKAAREALRVLKKNGIYIVKCQDEVCANRQRLTHVEVINELTKMSFVAEDIFVLLRKDLPGVSRMIKQVHARKNHSYFLVFRKHAPMKRKNI